MAQASKGESGYTNQFPGNQSGRELNISAWYNRPWDMVIRAIDPGLGAAIAAVATILVGCTQIGYDQINRTTLWDQCERIGWNIARISEIGPCECDCSSLVAVVLRFCGVVINKHATTYSLEKDLQGTGRFIILRDDEHTKSADNLHTGDILLNTQHHVAIAIENGAKVVGAVNYAAVVKVGDFLNVRTGPGTNHPIFQLEGKDLRLPNGMVIAICEEESGWGRVSDIAGWVSLKYLRR